MGGLFGLVSGDASAAPAVSVAANASATVLEIFTFASPVCLAAVHRNPGQSGAGGLNRR
ncbi:MAG TPA: hypothetical protein VH855_03140 [Acetobacteraceae bacterium]